MAKKQTNGNLALEQQRVIVIPAHDEIVARKLRVAAYARVSSSSEDQLNSYRVQNQYYSELISSNPDWEMADIYADEGITGTSVEKREDFQRVMQDCRKGKIDRILVKSISRFARNTKDCLAAVRELKELGVSVQFEEQGIDTSKVSSEMVTAIMASLAQKGSESISGNGQWGYQKRMESGKFNTCKAPYGFRLQNGQLVIEENEASVVRQIFDMFLNGNSREEIADALRAANLPTRKDVEMWAGSTVYHILRNKRYQSMYALQWYLGFFEHGGAGFPYSLYYHQQDFSRALSKECAITKFTLEGQDGVISNREITVKIPPLPLSAFQLAVAVLVKSFLRAVEHELHLNSLSCKSSVAHPASNTRDFFIKICRGQIYFLSAAFFFV